MSGFSEDAALAAQAVILQGERNYAALREIVAPDVVLEFPFHPNGAEIHHGADKMMELFRIIDVFDTLVIEPIQVFDAGNGNIIIEGRSVGTYRSDTPDYQNHYLFVFTIECGKITLWREFYNPIEAIRFYESYAENVAFAAQDDAVS
jgi:ketosteroid isomerase-like protein